MANEPPVVEQIGVCVCYALPDQVWLRALRLPAASTVADALLVSGFAQAFPMVRPWEQGVGVFGRVVQARTTLSDGDRVEIYRGLHFDPKESRRRRAEHRRAETARNGRVHPAGLL